MTPTYLAGRAIGFLVRPLLPLAESALAGVLDGLFGEPDLDGATYTPIANPRLEADEVTRIHREWLASIDQEVEEMDDTWTLPEERIAAIKGDAA